LKFQELKIACQQDVKELKAHRKKLKIALHTIKDVRARSLASVEIEVEFFQNKAEFDAKYISARENFPIQVSKVKLADLAGCTI
jgi:hypothetical protein